MDRDKLLKQLVARENESGCYEIIINGVRSYSLLREELRNQYLRQKGMGPISNLSSGASRSRLPFSIMMSFLHLIKLYIFRKKYSIAFFSFPRVDRINCFFLDKFVDPVIDESHIDNYIIFEFGMNGWHRKPRLHDNRVVYIDSLSLLAKIEDRFFYDRFAKRHRKELTGLWNCLTKVYGDTILDKNKVFHSLFLSLKGIDYYSSILKTIKAEIVIGPSLSYQRNKFVAAKRIGLRTFELQHGITFSETALYSGYRDKMIMPDKFLAFGNNDSLDVFGVEKENVINVGFALLKYIDRINFQSNINKDDVLVVSDPGITDMIIDFIIILSGAFPNVCFYFRPHPTEIITSEHRRKVSLLPNICFQDPSVNITVTLNSFCHIVGESSTVLYEALAMGKKVGRLKANGLKPLYLNVEDKAYFWEISSVEDFGRFINDNNKSASKSIYSSFNSELFLQTIGY